MSARGIRMQLLLGASLPTPAPPAVLAAVQQVEVRQREAGGDGFQLQLQLSRERSRDFPLMAGGLFEPPARLLVVVDLGGAPEVLIDGVVLHHQLAASATPGQSLLTVTGKDLSAVLDFEERQATYPNQGDSTIVTQLLAKYARYGLVPQVTVTSAVPLETTRVPTQHATDLALIRELARKNDFVFYVEPQLPGASSAYWGPALRTGLTQPALTLGLGGNQNVVGALQFGFDALGAESVSGGVLDPSSKSLAPFASAPAPGGSLAARQFAPLRRVLMNDAAQLDPGTARQLADARASQARDQLVATGEVDAIRYGAVLRARRLVAVRGAGTDHDGTYRVTEVTHRLRRGEYRQRFSLARDGRGATSEMVPT
jgi:hypothetical protein